MLNESERFEVMQEMTLAKQALNLNENAWNEFAMRIMLEDIAKLSERFKDLNAGHFSTAIAQCYRNKQAQQFRDFGITDLATELNTILGAIQAVKIANTQQLPAPKPAQGREWVDKHFRETYENAVNLGTHLFVPVWRLDPEAMKCILLDLAKHPDFHEGARANARLEASNLFKESLQIEWKAAQLQDFMLGELIAGRDFNNESERDALKLSLQRYQTGRVNVLKFDVESEWKRAYCLSACLWLGRLLYPQAKKTTASPMKRFTFVSTLEDI